ncbi:OmpA family protein [Sulfitobacter sp. M220]|uniref:OmpA family protein n=1 Tax=Sulfitobacter sp. M220 TaxID=2675333 RepID=UPI001F17D033|nr:OmpA family protein [Sulfitobacter sp. M220]MCF7779330.1 OmpA family protein [Sulfitobacter sp. M220]
MKTFTILILLSVAALPPAGWAGTLEALPAPENTTALTGSGGGAGLAARQTDKGLIAKAEGTGLIGRTEVRILEGYGGAGELSAEISPPPQPPPVRYVLADLRFDHDSAVLARTENAIIADLAQVIRDAAPACVHLTGHTSRLGPAALNQELSELRAGAVRDALVSQHALPRDLFRVAGLGESDLLSLGTTETDHALNRRVVVVLDCS